MRRTPTEGERALWERAAAARESAYAPYSDFAVGAALRSTDGVVFLGANVENAAYGLTICGERAAVCRAVSDGERDYDVIAVAADDLGRPAAPCAACRQVLAEFAPTLTVVYRAEGELVAEQLDSLLPASFE